MSNSPFDEFDPQSDPQSDPQDGPPPRDELDSLLRDWHEVNRRRAIAGRDQLLAHFAPAASAESARPVPVLPARRRFSSPRPLRAFLASTYARSAAALVALAVLVTMILPSSSSSAMACDRVIQAADAGRLDAIDVEGRLIGPCPLSHTDVAVTITGPFTRVNVRQSYSNPYTSKVEAVYTFPLSHRGAVDRMTMFVRPPNGEERVIVGEVKERNEARQTYESAKASGYVASLLEQERPNIFTQSVANIEPNASVIVEISYIETLRAVDGEYRFDFPMVVGPRYIPGSPARWVSLLPSGLRAKQGVVLLGPAGVEINGEASLTAGQVTALLSSAVALEHYPAQWMPKQGEPVPASRAAFSVRYANGSSEPGQIFVDGTGHVNGRAFYVDLGSIGAVPGGTDLVPDAARITPLPVRPSVRAGHDISLSVAIDPGGPAITELRSTNHEVVDAPPTMARRSGANARTITLRNIREIPNRDFVLSWKTATPAINESVFAYASPSGTGWKPALPGEGNPIDGSTSTSADGYFTLIVNPPARVENTDVRPRELIFVLDTSGSMEGFPIEKSKDVVARALSAMRPSDSFNIITFAGDTNILWSTPRSASPENLNEARAFIAARPGSGGTEMMKAIQAALVQTPNGGVRVLTPLELANLPADGRSVVVSAPVGSILSPSGKTPPRFKVSEGITVPLSLGVALPGMTNTEKNFRLSGTWSTIQGERCFSVTAAQYETPEPFAPTRIVMFLTDGMVGNDAGIIQAVRDNAKTTRVFSFGIGNSVNRWLLDQMAIAGRGASEFVQLASDGDAAVDRFTRRIQWPVLTDIEVTFSDGLKITDLVAADSGLPDGLVPDLFDQSPLVLHGRYSGQTVGTVTLTGRTAAGAWQRTLPLNPAAADPANDMLPSLWARAQVDATLAPHLARLQEQTTPQEVRSKVVALGVGHHIMTPFTSFVAVEKGRVTIGGRPMLVDIPIEVPEGTSFSGFLGTEQWRRVAQREAERTLALGARVAGDDAQDSSVITNSSIAIGLFEASSQPLVGPDSFVSLGFKYGVSGNPDEVAGMSIESFQQLPLEQRDQHIHSMLQNVRTLQMDMQYEGVLAEVDRILAVDPMNAAALTLRDAIRTTAEYEKLVTSELRKESGVSYLTDMLTQAKLPPVPNGNLGFFDGAPEFDIDAAVNQSGTTWQTPAAVIDKPVLRVLQHADAVEVAEILNRLYFTTNNSTISSTTASDPNFQLKDFFNQSGENRSTSKDAVVFDGFSGATGAETGLTKGDVGRNPEILNIDPATAFAPSEGKSSGNEISFPWQGGGIDATKMPAVRTVQPDSPDSSIRSNTGATATRGGTPSSPMLGDIPGLAPQFEQYPKPSGSPSPLGGHITTVGKSGRLGNRDMTVPNSSVPPPPTAEPASPAPNKADPAAAASENSRKAAGSRGAPARAATPAEPAVGATPSATPADAAEQIKQSRFKSDRADEVDKSRTLREAVPPPPAPVSEPGSVPPPAPAPAPAPREVAPSAPLADRGLEDLLKERIENLEAEGAKKEVVAADAHREQSTLELKETAGLSDKAGLPTRPEDPSAAEEISESRSAGRGEAGGADGTAEPAGKPAGPGGADGGSGGGSLFGGGGGQRYGYTNSADGISDEERREYFVETVMESVHTEEWTDNGGERLDLQSDDPALEVKRLENTPEVEAMARDAEKFMSAYSYVFFPSAASGGAPSAPQSGLVFAPEVAAVYDRLESTLIAPFESITFLQALDRIETAVGIPVNLAEESNRFFDVDLPVSIDAPTTAIEVLTDCVEEAAAGPSIDVSVDAITIVDRDTSPPVREFALYDVRDLMPDNGQSSEEQMDDLISVLTETVDPDQWTDNGGASSSVRAFDGRFFIRAPQSVHRGVQVLLAQLRNARGLPFNDVFRPAVAWRQSWSLATPPQTLMTVVYDARALLSAAALEYPDPDQMDDRIESIMNLLTEAVDPEGWVENGGDTSRLQFFGDCFIIQTTFENHGLIHLLFSRIAVAADFLHPVTPFVALAEAEPPAPALAEILDDADVLEWLAANHLTLAGPPQLSLLPDQAVLLANYLFNSAEPARARTVDEALIAAAPNLPLAISLHNIFTDPNNAFVRGERLMELAARSQSNLHQLAKAEQARELLRARLDHLRKTLDDRLLAVALADGLAGGVAESNSAEGKAAASQDVRGQSAAIESFTDLNSTPDGLLVTVSTSDTLPVTLGALKAAGMAIDDVSKPTRLVVGRIPVGKLISVAQVAAVKRIEPAELTPSPSAPALSASLRSSP